MYCDDRENMFCIFIVFTEIDLKSQSNILIVLVGLCPICTYISHCKSKGLH